MPGFEGLPLYDVTHFFFNRLKTNELQIRARATAFSFLLALFPGIIFLFTLIPYIPIDGLQDRILSLMESVLPDSAYQASRSTIEDIILHQRGGLLSVGFLFALYVTTDGILALMIWFNRSFHGHQKRSDWHQRLVALFLTFCLTTLLFTAITLLIVSEFINQLIRIKPQIDSFTDFILLQVVKWVILLLLCFLMISLLYFFGPSRHDRLRFITPGSTLSTILIVITSICFKFFIENFGTYNKIYGSIGTLIVILLWLYINSLVVLIGYELNISIKTLKHKNRSQYA